MKFTITWIFGCWLASGCLPLVAATFYVAPDGKDDNAGTVTTPFASLQRAQRAASPGDTVQVRGGTYKMKDSQLARPRRGRAVITHLTKSGLAGKPITYQAYADEHPIFDCTEVKPVNSRVTAFQIDGSWLHLKGLAVTGVQVTILGHTQSICFDNQGDHNRYEQLQMHDGQAIGFWLGKGSHNLVLNCDAWQNYDYTSEDHRGGNVDGFGFHVPPGSVGNIFRGCRAWFNSDDGFDFISTAESVTVEDCWAFYNGFGTKFNKLGDGNGFKAGGYAATPQEHLPKVIPRHILRHCLAVKNRASGFYANHQPGGNDWLNNTAWNNSANFNLLSRTRDNLHDVPGHGHLMRNNLGFQGHSELKSLNEETSDAKGNYWNLPVKVTAEDFASLDEAQLALPRQANGDLPKITLLQLVAGSDLIDAGQDVKLKFAGKAPDLGCFEHQQ
jgi:hypothetical protein